jgi:hypothetical protein
MMHHNRRRALLGLQQEACRQAHSYVLFGMEECEEFGLVPPRDAAGWVAEGIARAAILLMEEVANMR